MTSPTRGRLPRGRADPPGHAGACRLGRLGYRPTSVARGGAGPPPYNGVLAPAAKTGLPHPRVPERPALPSKIPTAEVRAGFVVDSRSGILSAWLNYSSC